MNPVHQLVLSHRGYTVGTVIVDGEVVLRDGHTTRVDEQAVYARSRESIKAVFARLGIEPFREWTETS